MTSPTPPRRRAFLVGLLGAAGTAACSGGTGAQGPGDPTTGGAGPATGTAPASPSGTATRSPTTTTTSPPSPTATLEPSPAWSPGRGELEPQIKVEATRFVQLAGTWEASAGTLAATASRLAGGGVPVRGPRVPVALTDGAAAASTRIVYPQYGGLAGRLASVMVVARQDLLDADGSTRARDVAVDVRLSRTGGRWRVDGAEPPKPAAAPVATSAVVTSALANPDLVLPGSARDDVLRGRVSDDVMALLDRLADGVRLDVSVLVSGHPVDVFATDRVSNHTRGRAVDIWAVDGQPVADPRTSRDLLRRVMVRAAELGATEVGGPFDVNGRGPGFFTDRVHHDHLHLGLTAGKRPARP